MINWLKSRLSSIKAKIAKRIVIKETVRVLSLAHAEELKNTPGEQWVQVRATHIAQIEAVRAGNMNVVDRRSFPLPYLPLSVQQIKQPIIKQVPWSVRQFSRTPTVRRCINMIRNSVVSLEWGIQPIGGAEPNGDQLDRINIAKNCFLHPNDIQSLQTFLEMGIDEFCVNGALPIELQLTPSPTRPFKMWVMDASTVRIFPDWKESMQDQPRFAQMTGLRGERGILLFYDDEMAYIPDNPAADTPFGTSKVEVGFKHIGALIGVQDMSSRAGTDQVHKTWLWWAATQTAANIDTVRRHIDMNIEGMSRLSLTAGMQKPDVIDVTPVSIEDLLIPWQEMCKREIANAFDLSSLAVGLEQDVNRAVGEVLDDKDFRSAVMPLATRVENEFTKSVLHRLLGWKDLEFKFLNMDDPDAQTKMTMNQQLYAVNGMTANEIRVSMGKPKLLTPLADLTQIELTILYAQMASTLQNQAADKAATRQVGQQKSMMDLQQQYGNMGDGSSIGDQGSGQDGDSPGNAPGAGNEPKKPGAGSPFGSSADLEAGGGAGGPKPVTAPKVPQAPKPVTLPKAPQSPPPPKLPMPPMAGSIYTADQVSKMKPAQIDDAMKKGHLPPTKKAVKQQMQTQDPFILQTLCDELKQYFEDQDDNKEKSQLPKNPSKADLNKQDALYKQKKHILAPIEKETFIVRDKSQNMYRDRRNNPNASIHDPQNSQTNSRKTRRRKKKQ